MDQTFGLVLADSAVHFHQECVVLRSGDLLRSGALLHFKVHFLLATEQKRKTKPNKTIKKELWTYNRRPRT